VGALEWDLYKESMLLNSADLDDIVGAFGEAGRVFADLAGRPEVGKAWDQPSALAGYSVGAIVTHVNAAIGWLGPLLDAPVPPDRRPTRRTDYLEYFQGLKIPPDGAGLPIHDLILEKSERAARHGWESNRDRFAGVFEQLLSRLEGESGERLLDLGPALPLVIRLGDFLPSRVLELVVHGDDLAASVGLELPPLSEATTGVAIDVMVDIARAGHGDLAILRALARRERSTAEVFPVL
jgi:hypothetical protein